MKVKLLKKIRKRFCIINASDNEFYYSQVEYMSRTQTWQNKVIFDRKTCDEYKFTVYYSNLEIREILRNVCRLMDNIFFNYTNMFDKKLLNKKNNKLKNKYRGPSVKK